MAQTTILRKAAYLVGARRTPFGAFGGTLKGLTATDLGVEAATATLASAGLDPAKVGSVIFGNVAQTSVDAIYQARHVGIRAGCPTEIPALTVNRLCGSGFEAVTSACAEIETAGTGIVLAGGTESMSQAPHCVRNLRWGTKLGFSPELEDTLWSGLTDSLCGLPMGITAENLAEEYNITRDDADAFGLRSQNKWKEAHDAGVFDAEVAAVVIKGKRGKDMVFEVDEHPKPNSNPESMAKLPSSFKKEGTVTAANASGICDGAAAVLVASEEAAAAEGLEPLVRVVGYSVVGVDPTKMGIGPVPAIQALVSAAGITLNDVELVEVNEAFASQCLAVQKALGIDDNRLNPHGGAIALGHPLGASGARIIGHIAHNTTLWSRYAIGSACIGGGQGIAVLLERV